MKLGRHRFLNGVAVPILEIRLPIGIPVPEFFECQLLFGNACHELPFLHYFNFRGFLLPSEMRSSRLGPGAGKLDKAADRNATGALGEPRLWIIQPGGRGNIQMNPRGRVGELL